MSRAFVREPDGSEPPEPPPERPVPPGPNPVTASGLVRMEAELARLLALSSPDPMEQRNLHYWRQRRASAQLTAPPKGRAAGFGSWLTVADGGAAPCRLRIVGEDEANPSAGLIGWRAPLALALEGAEPGNEVEGPGGRIFTVLAVENDAVD
ncbi:hypothetical protein D9599_02780 [Roseomonas sp. KE2513]|uniref:GreA/GreB family elongation factor n=1 Tax=Roseomonas sp. KE2513 TaxID=2479202 RepID=UPI0018DFCECD|nr:GreA/GreB family elongation factor [Roseomonas sp. KE2513]MBI0534494.1 hypothetical protein [Roseomonas sp. KE2513]